ncbi:hypothetical protein QNA08_18030 [Chelatococcus sp. SYSU_G07232]|uniref:Uncharacterized protein n=1 Tax=Chelatococcus albus TaxID=3047466 RepID=A0ABT7AL71_9HYPH|nr:hypothetical protein [Chelatococcus sp. SYSU_G07232]MDJ1160114.1 hypothetical protein [Chelatococcus sp. SYSU_G07232]
MSFFDTPNFLRRVLFADAATSTIAGLVMLAGADVLAGPPGLPAALLRHAGLALLPFAAFVAVAAARRRLSRAAVWVIIACNGLWAAESLLLIAGGWIVPNIWGQAFVVAQALVVALFAEAEFIGLRRSAPAAA